MLRCRFNTLKTSRVDSQCDVQCR
uniref:Uncharacterized protein n=1 Tax=Arundo donax TaxID=35708 RepID=A0A0A8XNN9_ARUDO